jgi:hypothetical protein
MRGIGRKPKLSAVSAAFPLAIPATFDVCNTSVNDLLFDEGRSLAGRLQAGLSNVERKNDPRPYHLQILI